MTLIKSEYGRCDKACYDAATPRCDCICGGRNHGVGLNKAIENTRDMAERLVGVKFSRHITTGDLFGGAA